MEDNREKSGLWEVVVGLIIPRVRKSHKKGKPINLYPVERKATSLGQNGNS
jgi:hypothetical protein